LATSVTFNATTYSIPASGETAWSSLSSFLIAVANNAQVKNTQIGATRIATSSPVTVTTTDYVVLSNLAVAGAVAVTLPAGTDGRIFVVGDAKGDAATNNITVTPTASTINGAATFVLSSNKAVVALQYSSTASEWKVIGQYLGTSPLPVASGGTNSSTALSNNRVMRSSGGAVVEAAAITATRALVSDANGIPTHSAVTATELGYVSGVTSAIQTQLDGKQATGNYITALTGDVTASGPGSVAGTVNTVGGAAAADVATATTLANAATSANTNSAIVRRDGSGNFSAGTITANLTGNASGTAANVTGTVAIANGGTGQTAKTAAFDALSPTTSKGDLIVSDGTDNIRLAVGADGTVLTADSGQTSGLNWTTPLTNPMNASGDIIYGAVAGAATRLAGNITTTRNFLRQTGSGAASAAPAWDTIVANDVNGRTDGASASAGKIGETVASTNDASTSAGTSYADVGGSSIALTAGVWLLQYSVSAQLTIGSASGIAYGQIKVTDSTNSDLSGTSRQMVAGGNGSGENDRGGGTLAMQHVISISGATTYKLRCRLVEDTGSGHTFTLYNQSNKESTFHAIRIA
jgi:hypothetical protein